LAFFLTKVLWSSRSGLAEARRGQDEAAAKREALGPREKQEVRPAQGGEAAAATRGAELRASRAGP
jgi:hypothetical protein